MPRQSRPPAVSRLLSPGHLLLTTSVLALCGALGTALPAEAASATIVSGQVAAQQTLTNGDTLTVDNGGTVVDNNNAVSAPNVGSTVTVLNSGVINSLNQTGVYASQSTLNLTNSSAGHIDGAQEGVYASTINSLVNSGVIHGFDAGIDAGAIFYLTNSGTVDGAIYGISATTIGTLVNSNMITGGDHGIKTDGAITDLTNSGTISGSKGGIYAGGGIGSLTNTNLISSKQFGIESSASIGTLTNSGTIVSQQDDAIHVSADIGLLTNLAHGTITGGTGHTSIYLGGTLGSLTNDGTITGDAAGVSASGDIDMLVNGATGVISGQSGIGIYSGASIGSLNNSGIILGYDDYAIRAHNDIGSLTNSGVIASAGSGIGAGGNIDTLVNETKGTISGSQLDGVFVSSTLKSLTNDGLIVGTIAGVHANGGITALTNSGSGTISGGQWGVFTLSSIGSLTNSGNIVGLGDHAIMAQHDIGSLTNSGTIAGFGDGIQAGGTINTLVNSAGGTISGGQNSYGIRAQGIAALTNSGLIKGGDTTQFAIDEDPNSNTDTLLTLNAGSVLIGHVLISGGNDTLNVGNGLNLALTFDNSVPELIETNGAASVVIGNTVYVADMATVTGAAGLAADLSGSIAGAVSGALDKGFDEKGVDGHGHFWLQGIGGMGHEAEGNGGSAANDWFGGAVLGGDFGADADTPAGFFLGAARGSIDATASSNTADSFFGGIYGSHQFEDFSVKGQLSGGFTRGNLSRTIANNTLATGLETATATDDAYFISPGITFTNPWVTSNMAFETSLAVNYTGVFSGGFTETGAIGAMSVGANSQHIFDVQALLRLPFEQTTESGMLTGDLHTGLVGRAQFSTAGLTGTLAGTDVTLAAAGTSASAGVVAGGAMSFDMGGGAKIFAGLDGTLRSGFSTAFTANAGIKGAF